MKLQLVKDIYLGKCWKLKKTFFSEHIRNTVSPKEKIQLHSKVEKKLSRIINKDRKKIRGNMSF